MSKKIKLLLLAFLAWCGMVQAQDVTFPVSGVACGWCWSNLTFTYGVTNPATSTLCDSATVTQVDITNYWGGTVGISNAAVSDWSLYDRIEILVYPTISASSLDTVTFIGWYDTNGDGDAQNVVVGANSMEEASLTANTWQKITLTLPTTLVNNEDASISYSSLGDTTLNLNTIMVQFGLSAASGTIYIGGITLKEKSAVAPTSITLSPASLEMITGKSFTYTTTIAPDDASKSLGFVSSSSALTVDNDGNATSVSAGAVTVTATSTIASISGTSSITVTAPDAANSVVYADFENSNPFTSVWGTTSAAVAVNPSKTTDNSSASVFAITSATQWTAVAFTDIDVNKINKISWWVYSETALTDFLLKVGLNQIIDKEISVSLPAATWTKMEWTITDQVFEEISDDDVFYIQMASSGAATTGYSYYLDNIQLVAGSSFTPVASFDIQGKDGVSAISQTGTLQMEVVDLLPASATNTSVVWSVSDETIATIDASTGLLTAVAPGEVTVTAQADGGGYSALTVITINSSDATLASLSTSKGTLAPAFSAAVTSYTVELPSGTTVVTIVSTVTAVANESHATVSIVDATSLPGTTTVTVTAADGTIKTYSISFTTATSSVAPIVEGGLIVYPNPAKDMLRVASSSISLVEVIDFAGQTVLTASQNNISVAGLAQGVYSVRVTTTDGKTQVSSFIKQ